MIRKLTDNEILKIKNLMLQLSKLDTEKENTTLKLLIIKKDIANRLQLDSNLMKINIDQGVAIVGEEDGDTDTQQSESK